MSTTVTDAAPIRAVTRGPRHHFFGYYDKPPWDGTGRYLLALETAFMDRPPTPADAATIGLVDTEQGDVFTPLTTTRAWNWQQGCMLHWLPTAPDREIIFNDREENRFVAVIVNVQTGARRVLPHPIYALSPDGRTAITPNFSRLAVQRPGYGYAGVPDRWADVQLPEDDGIYAMNLDTGESRLLFSIAQIARAQWHADTMSGVMHWFNHLQFSPGGQRFCFLHRWRNPATGTWFTQLWTVNADGSMPRCVLDDDYVSHFDWYDAGTLVAWGRQHGRGEHYYRIPDRDGSAVTIIGEDVFTTDGHCSFSPDRRWMLTDTYPDPTHHRTLMLYDLAAARRVNIGQFYSPPGVSGELRCDLHPRWSRDGSQVCIDSTHTGERQMYVLDVSAITRPRPA